MKVIKRYAEIRAESKKLTEEAKELEPQVTDLIMAQDGERLETAYATFSFVSYKKWKYSEALVKTEKTFKEQVAVLKKNEEIEGKAEKLADGVTLRVNLKKEDK